MSLSFLELVEGLYALAVIFPIYMFLLVWEINAVTSALLQRQWISLPVYFLSGNRRATQFDLSSLSEELDAIDRLCAAEANGEAGRIGAARLENCIDAVWHKVDQVAYLRIAGLGGHIYALILWGFAGTIFGSMIAFQNLSAQLENVIVDPSQLVREALGGGLYLALFSSLVASVIGAVVMLFRRMLLSAIGDFEAVVRARIDEILGRHGLPSRAEPEQDV